MNNLTRRSVLIRTAAASAAVVPLTAVTVASPTPDAAILALADQVVELIDLDEANAAWQVPLGKLIDAQARTIDGLLAKAHAWEACERDLDDIAVDDLHGSIVCDLLNWEVM
jgi:hypothetical protein